MAAAHRREIYSELSFITHEHRKGPVFLAWVYDRMRDPKYRKESWWATTSINRTCAAWISEWQASFLPRQVWAVSGICSSDALTFK